MWRIRCRLIYFYQLFNVDSLKFIFILDYIQDIIITIIFPKLYFYLKLYYTSPPDLKIAYSLELIKLLKASQT